MTKSYFSSRFAGAVRLCGIGLATSVSLAPVSAQLLSEVDAEAAIEAEAAVAPLGASGNAKASASPRATLGAQVDKATSAVVNSGAAATSAAKKQVGKIDVVPVVEQEISGVEAAANARLEAAAEARARAKLNAQNSASDAASRSTLSARTQLEKQRGVVSGAARAGSAQAASVSGRNSSLNSNVGEAETDEPVIGTYEAIDTNTAIENDARNGGQQLSTEARAGVQLVLPGTGVERKSNRSAIVNNEASSRFLIRQERTASPETYAAVDRVFAKADTDGDGELSPEERANASAKFQLSAVFKVADTNRDGVVSRAELTTAMDASVSR